MLTVRYISADLENRAHGGLMGFIDLATSSVWGFVSSAVPFLIVLTLIVFVHEYGHFKVARC